MPGIRSRVVVDGDMTVDWNLAGDGEAAHGRTSVSHRPGGVALLADVLAALTAGSPDTVDLVRPDDPVAVGPDDPRMAHAWALWRSGPKGSSGWWVDHALGLSMASAPEPVKPVDADADVVVIDDTALGFRDDAERWPVAIRTDGAQPWVVLKMAAPVAAGPLWEHLHGSHRDRLVVVVTVDDLRRTRVQVSRGLSWERTAQDLAWELTHNLDVHALAECAHVVVTFGAAGAVVVSRAGGGPTYSLVFDPMVMEGEWEQSRPGAVIGTTATLTACLARDLATGAGRHDDLAASVARGLTGVRALLDSGYEADDHGRLLFPFARVVAGADRTEHVFDRVEVRDPVRLLARPAADAPARRGYWTILEETYPGALDDVARRVVVEGPGVLRGVPHGRFGKLLTVDRHEIESLRAIRGLMEEYCRLDRVAQPLSIAVFGPPGSGKSFGVAQVAGALLPDRVSKLDFNLSQFDSADDLVDALHQVRDTSLSGKIPLVFWDEFDTPLDGEPLGWLKHFLAPMQDGAFRQGQLVHPIGRAVFVFAGGTAASIQEFGHDLSDEQLRSAKQPDFVSRLRGYLDVLGPNPHPVAGELDTDRFYGLRRAILLESMLRRKAPQLVHVRAGKQVVDIDSGVLQAFLDVPAYRHGARSMEAVIDMSRLSGLGSYQRSSLPSEAQLDLHVDGARFLALVQRLELSGVLLEQLAAAAHEVFREDLVRRGYRPGPVRDDDSRISPKLCSYEELPEEDKEQNRANVRDIPAKLAHAGFLMVPAKSEETNAGFPGELLEELSRDEHDRWMRTKLAQGWVHGSPTDDAAKRHDSLVPWEDLPEIQRQKDRALVLGIATVLARCGYAVVRAPS